MQLHLLYGSVNHYPHAIEAALEDAKIEGMVSRGSEFLQLRTSIIGTRSGILNIFRTDFLQQRPSFTAIFPYRPINDNNNPGTECMCIVYLPTCTLTPPSY